MFVNKNLSINSEFRNDKKEHVLRLKNWVALTRQIKLIKNYNMVEN